MNKINKYRLLSYSIIVILYLIATVQIMFYDDSIHQKMTALEQILILVAAFVYALLNCLALYLIANKNIINFSITRDKKLLKAMSYIVTGFMMLLGSIFLLVYIEFFVIENQDKFFINYFVNSLLMIGVVIILAVTEMLSMSIGKKK